MLRFTSLHPVDDELLVIHLFRELGARRSRCRLNGSRLADCSVA